MTRSSAGLLALLLVSLAFGCDRGPAGAPAPVASPATAAAPAAAPAAAVTGLARRKVLDARVLPSVAVAVAPVPDGSGFFVLGRNGGLHRFAGSLGELEGFAPDSRDGVVMPTGRVQIPGTYASGDMGSIGLALDPDHVRNAMLYVWYADEKDEYVVLDRFTWKGDEAAILASRTEIIRIGREDPPYPYHMGGVVRFLPDGTLLIGVGDAERCELAQDPRNLNGKILRIRPRTGPEGGYDVPADNPFVGDDAARPEIVASGWRMPFRSSLKDDRFLFVADVGSGWEEIDVVDLAAPGGNYGWGIKADSCGVTGIAGTVDPILVWSARQDFAAEDPEYTGDVRVSAGVGPFYAARTGGDRYAGMLSDRLLVFDVMRGWVRAVALTDDHDVSAHRHVGHVPFPAQMIEGDDGFVYAVSWGPRSTVWRLQPEVANAPSREITR